jgi:hypothetical protein
MADIPIDAIPRRVQFTGNTGLGPFAFTFNILAAADIAVYKNATLLTITTDYTVSLNANGTGSVTLTGAGSGTALVAADYLTIIGDLPLARTTDFTTAGDLLASALNDQLDASVVMTQQISERVDRALRQDPNDVDGDMTIPEKSARLGKYLKFNDTTGNPEVGSIAGAYTAAGMNHYNFTGDGTTVNFTLGMEPGGENNTQVYIDGVYQQKDGYNVSGAVVQFSVAPPNLSTIEVMVIEVLPVGATTASQVSFTQAGSTYGRNVQLKLQETVSVKDFGAVGDGVTDDTVAVTAFLTSIISTGDTGLIPEGIYLVDTISLVAGSGFNLIGSGTIKATGSNRLNMLVFSGTVGTINIDGITIDGNNIVARPLDIQNLSSTASTLGSVCLGESLRIINAKNNTPSTYTASGIWVEGGFTEVVFSGEINGVDSTLTSGASCAGLDVTWDAGAADDWVRHTIISSSAKIRNVKNSNSALADADGIRVFAPTTNHAFLTVNSGALFENCKGRSIKSQVVGNAINGPIIKRSLYDGLVEIDLQYAGGYVSGALVLHEGMRVDTVINASPIATPSNTHCLMEGNQLTVTGSPSSNTGAMTAFTIDNATTKIEGAIVKNNMVKGAVNYMTSCRVANVVDVNYLILEGNWAETIGTAYINMWLYGSNRAQLSLNATNNTCVDGCTGIQIVSSGDLKVIDDRNNIGLTALLSTPYSYEIASGSISPKGEKNIRVATEGAAASDDLDTIVGTNYGPDEFLTLIANTDAKTVVCKDGTGNLRLSGDFSLDNDEDRITLSYNGTNWCEISRSANSP